MIYTLFALFIVSLPWQTRSIFVQTDNPYTTLSVYGFDIVYALLVIVFLVWWRRQKRVSAPPFMLMLLTATLTILVLLSAYWAVDRTVSFYYWIRLVQGLGLLVMVVTARPPLWLMLHAFIINGLVQSGFGFWQTITQYVTANKWLGIAAQLPETFGTPVVLTDTGRFLRAFGTMPHPNIAGGMIVLGLVSAVLLWQISRSTHSMLTRYYILIVTTILSLGLIVTFSRSAILAWGITIVVITIWGQRATLLAKPVILTSLVMLLLAAIIYAPMLSSRVQASSSIETNSLQERSTQLHQAWEIWPQYIVQGTGIGGYTLAIDKTIDKTNSLTERAEPLHVLPWLIIIEIGMIAGIGFIWLLIWSIMHTRWRDPVSSSTALLLLIILIIGIFDHYFWTIPAMWFMWMIIIGIHIITSHNATTP